MQPTYTIERPSTICEQRNFGTDYGSAIPGMQPSSDPRASTTIFFSQYRQASFVET
jgi:hypothetical protein